MTRTQTYRETCDDLFERFVNGDRDVLGEFMRIVRKPLTWRLFELGHPVENIRDAFQDAAVDLLRKPPKWTRGPASSFAYFKVIMKRILYDNTVKKGNLDGWYTYLAKKGKNNDPDNVFSIKDGQIHICGEEMGGITTTEEYGNYVLDVEFKTGEKSFGGRTGKGFDSGILIHCQGKDAAFGPWMSGIQVCVIDGACGDLVIVVGKGKDAGFSLTSTVKPGSKDSKESGMDFDPNGEPVTLTDLSRRINRIGRDPQWKDIAGFRGKNEIESPAGKWNHMRIVAAEDTIEVYLNEKLVNRATNVKPVKGRIQIQAEAAEYFYRRINLTPL